MSAPVSKMPLDGPPSEGPYEHLLFWRPDGSGVRVCVDAQRIYFSRSGDGRSDADRAIQARYDQFGLRYRKADCPFCGGVHLELVPENEAEEGAQMGLEI